jgi:hypothetical protein
MNTPNVPAIDIPEVDIVTVTPDLAKKWLAQNSHNRPLRKRAITDYARDMAAGHWLQNGEAIKFAEDGTLLDGQHRLHAVVASGATVMMLVVSGLPLSTQETMDAGRKRTTSDAFGLRGEVNAATLAAVVKRVWLWEQGDFKFATNYTPTTAECSELLKAHPEIYRSVEIAVRIHQTFRYVPQSITGTCHHLFSRISTEDAVWFFARLGDGAELPADHPVLTLRNRVMNDRAERLHVPDYRFTAYLIRAWNAVRQDRPLSKIQQATDAPMPMPK